MGVKTSSDTPDAHQQYDVSSDVLQTYAGVYESDHFGMVITLENGNLFAQPPGSDKLPMQPIADNKFLIKEIGAEIEFLSTDSNGKQSQTINILLEGNIMVAVKQ